MMPIKHVASAGDRDVRRRRNTGVATLGRVPFTLSHPAAVLPLRRLGLPVTVLVIASMVPDVPVFMGWNQGYDFTHSPLGVLTADLVVTSVVVAWWTFVMRDALVDLGPARVRSRLPASARLTRREWLLLPAAAVVGATTHVVWDAFTHPGRWGWQHFEWLRSDHGGLSGVSWAQYVSGVVGLAVVVAAAVAHLRGVPPVQDGRRPRVLPAATLPVIVAIAGLTAVAAAAWSLPDGLHLMAFNAVVDSMIVLGALLVIVTVAWQVAARRAGMPGAPSELNDA
ncbi:MAG: DUF4184 family protein [Aeromicrobium sp.]